MHSLLQCLTNNWIPSSKDTVGSHPVKDFINLISNEVEKITGFSGAIKNVAWPKEVNEIEKRNYIASIELFKSLTGWEPSVSLEEGIQLLVKHYSKEYISNEVS